MPTTWHGISMLISHGQRFAKARLKEKQTANKVEKLKYDTSFICLRI